MCTAPGPPAKHSSKPDPGVTGSTTTSTSRAGWNSRRPNPTAADWRRAGRWRSRRVGYGRRARGRQRRRSRRRRTAPIRQSGLRRPTDQPTQRVLTVAVERPAAGVAATSTTGTLHPARRDEVRSGPSWRCGHGLRATALHPVVRMIRSRSPRRPPGRHSRPRRASERRVGSGFFLKSPPEVSRIGYAAICSVITAFPVTSQAAVPLGQGSISR